MSEREWVTDIMRCTLNRWRDSKNPWRKFGVTALPTLYKVTPDGVSRLALGSCLLMRVVWYR